jgi:adenylate cyclase class IV
MARHKEVELKWSADHIQQQTFIDALKAYLDNGKYIYELVSPDGPDVYYEMEGGATLRHRKSADCHELTSKLRLSNHSTKVRKEVNVELSLKTKEEDVQALLEMVGFVKSITIHKYCSIFFINGSKSRTSIVWYRVICKGQPDRVFLEIEVEGISSKKAQRTLDAWTNRLQRILPISKNHLINSSLYEIYTGKRYLKIKDF